MKILEGPAQRFKYKQAHKKIIKRWEYAYVYYDKNHIYIFNMYICKLMNVR